MSRRRECLQARTATTDIRAKTASTVRLCLNPAGIPHYCAAKARQPTHPLSLGTTRACTHANAMWGLRLCRFAHSLAGPSRQRQRFKSVRSGAVGDSGERGASGDAGVPGPQGPAGAAGALLRNPFLRPSVALLRICAGVRALAGEQRTWTQSVGCDAMQASLARMVSMDTLARLVLSAAPAQPVSTHSRTRSTLVPSV